LKFKYIILFFFVCRIAFPQSLDTTNIFSTPDSLNILSSSLDTLLSTNQRDSISGSKYDIDDIVYAQAEDSLVFNIKEKKMNLYGKSELKYKNTELKSGIVYMDFETSELEAIGTVDTTDTTGKSFTDLPELSEMGEVYKGASLRYNFKTQKGFISMAANEAEGQSYRGDKVKKINSNTYYIEDGIYTTCPGDEPDTYFYARQMKVILREQIIAKWIWLYIGGVPFPVPLPFGVFPNETGRRSGIIPPSFGSRVGYGQYFSGFGYFWAINDYVDLNLTGDYYTKGGFGLAGRFRYVKRYEYNGSIEAGYSNLHTGEEDDPTYTQQKDWRLMIFHNQKFNPTTRLDIYLRFQSNEYTSRNSTNLNDLLQQNIYSSASFFKSWESTGNSISINYRRTQNIQNGDINEMLPDVTFTRSQSYPFKSKVSSGESKWYELLGYSYSGQFQNRRNIISDKFDIRGGVQHQMQFNASPKIGYFSVSPRLSYREKWYNKFTKTEFQTSPTSGRDTLISSDQKDINFVRTFDMSVSASTRLYGIFQPNAFGIEAFRHTINPSVSYSYTPDFSSDTWGYYASYIDTSGREIRYDKFGKEIFGGVSSGEQQNINFNIGNIFELKTIKDPTDTTSESKKIQLLNLDASLSYNFAADSLKLSDLRLNYRTQIGSFLNLYGNSSYTFYDFNNRTRINKTLLSQGKGLFRLTNFGFSVSTSLSGEKLSGTKENIPEGDDESFAALERNDYVSLYREEIPDLSIPWNLSLSYNYNISKPFPTAESKTSNMSLDFSMNLTKLWKISMRGSYDFINEQVSAPQVRIYRDLGCWEMNFTWNPLGTYRGYRFELRIKAPQLQDLKVTKSRGLYSGRRY